MRLLRVENGSKGPFFGKNENGKVILIDRRSRFQPTIGEWWECKLTEKERFFIATPLRKAEPRVEIRKWDWQVPTKVSLRTWTPRVSVVKVFPDDREERIAVFYPNEDGSWESGIEKYLKKEEWQAMGEAYRLYKIAEKEAREADLRKRHQEALAWGRKVLLPRFKKVTHLKKEILPKIKKIQKKITRMKGALSSLGEAKRQAERIELETRIRGEISEGEGIKGILSSKLIEIDLDEQRVYTVYPVQRVESHYIEESPDGMRGGCWGEKEVTSYEREKDVTEKYRGILNEKIIAQKSAERKVKKYSAKIEQLRERVNSLFKEQRKLEKSIELFPDKEDGTVDMMLSRLSNYFQTDSMEVIVKKLEEGENGENRKNH